MTKTIYSILFPNEYHGPAGIHLVAAINQWLKQDVSVSRWMTTMMNTKVTGHSWDVVSDNVSREDRWTSPARSGMSFSGCAVRRRPSVGPELLDAWFSLKRSATEHSWTSPGAVTAELTRGPAVMSRLYKVTQRQYGKVHYSWIRGKHVCGSCAGQMAHRRERHVLQATINSEIFFSGEEHGRSECLTSPRISALYLLYGSLLKKKHICCLQSPSCVLYESSVSQHFKEHLRCSGLNRL